MIDLVGKVAKTVLSSTGLYKSDEDILIEILKEVKKIRKNTEKINENTNNHTL